jgi:hypothetical protein
VLSANKPFVFAMKFLLQSSLFYQKVVSLLKEQLKKAVSIGGAVI